MSFAGSIARAIHDWNRSVRDQQMAPTQAPIPLLRSRSLVDRLPTELLTTVFVLAIEKDAHDSLTTSPTTLSHVSRRWRLLALATGQLWTRLTLTYPTDTAQVTRFLTYIARARTYPLSLTLDFRDENWDFELPEECHPFTLRDMHLVLRLLGMTKSAPRWRSVELITDSWAPIWAFLRSMAQQTRPGSGTMQKLILCRCNAYFAKKGQLFEPAELRSALPLFGVTSYNTCTPTPPTSPSQSSDNSAPPASVSDLRTLSLVGVHVDWRSIHLVVGQKLTNLVLKYHAADVRPSPTDFCRMLRACPALETLTVVGSGPSFPASFDPSSLPPITLGALTSLTFGFVDPTEATQLLALLRLPLLAELKLEDVAAGLNLLADPEYGIDENLMPVILPPRVFQPDSDEDRAPRAVLNWLVSGSDMPLGKITSLSLASFCIAPDTPPLLAFFQQCTNVEEITVVGAGCTRITGVLTGDDVLALRRNGDSCMLPSLKAVIGRGHVLTLV